MRTRPKSLLLGRGRRSLLLLLLALLSVIPIARAQQFQWADAIYNPPGTGSAWVNSAALDEAGNAYVSFGGIGDLRFGGADSIALDPNPRAFLAQYRTGGTLGWVKRGLTAAHLLTNAEGDVFATGTFSGRLVIDGTTLTTSGTDYYAARWTSAGVLRWAVQGGASGSGGDRTPAHLALDALSNVYLTGQFSGVSSFGSGAFTLTPTSGTGANSSSAFVVKLTGANGAAQWAVGTANAAVAGATSRGQRLGTDQSGRVYVLGLYAFGSGMTGPSGSVTFPVPPGSAEQLFWLKLDAAGQPEAARALPLPPPGTEPGFAVDATGYAYLANTFQGTVDFGGQTLTAGGGEDTYVARFDPNGVLQWTNRLGGTTPLDLTNATDLALDAQNRVMVAGFFQGQAATGTGPASVTFGAPFHPTLNPDLDPYLAVFDQLTGTPQWALTGGGAADEEGSRVAVSTTGNVLLVGRTLSDTARFGGATVGALLNPTPKVFVAYGLSGHNTLRGKAFVDTNADGLQNPGETGYAGGVLVNVLAGTTVVATARTQPDGSYETAVPLGTFTTALPAPPPHHTVVASGPTGTTFNTYGNLATAATYALQPLPGLTDVQVLLTPLSRVRAGRLAPYRIAFRNVGTTTIASGQVTLQFEPLLNYLGSTPTATRAGTTLTWTYANLAPGQTRSLEALFSLPTTAPLGDSIRCVATITTPFPDATPADNSEANRRVITGSFDPNLLEVNYDEMTTTQVGGGEWVQYTVHFQNLGTDTAFSVMVIDSLPTNRLNVATLQFQSSSHSLVWWTPGPNGVLTVEFPNILLPNQANDAIRSNGHVRFRARPLPWLAIGERIQNRAFLYFDYNPHLATNTASTLITGVTGLPDSPLSQSLLATAWPNPATDHLTIEGWLPDTGPLTLRLFDAAGRTVSTRQTPHGGAIRQELDVRTLPPGLYLLELRCGATKLTKRVVIE